MARLKKMEKYYMIIVFLVLVFILTIFYLPSLNTRFVSRDPTKEINFDENGLTLLKLIKNSFNKEIYSKWPKFISLKQYSLLWPRVDDTREDYFQKLKCLNNKRIELKISNFKEIISIWSLNSDIECKDFYKRFTQIYDIQFKNSVVRVPSSFESKVKTWLGNNEQLFSQVNNQTLIYIYNRFTYEENMFNLLRGKRPQKIPQVKPDDYYRSLIEESGKTCDFCNYKDFTALNEYERFDKENAFSAANIFPFNEYHSIFLPKKHDLLTLTFKEFKQTFDLPIEWFNTVLRLKPNSNYLYPVLLWDFLPKGGASQVHPHLQVTVNNERYYGNFEIIRNGAEKYYKSTNNNYFTDFVKIHNILGLSLIHENAVAIFPITPKKEFDVTIISEDYNSSVVELIYAVLKTYVNVLKIYPFSMSIYYPQLNENESGRIPLYCKIVPRGDLSTPSSEISSLELLSIFNSNKEQYSVYEIFQKSLKDELKKIVNENE